jgi:hypothetical protein
MQTAKHELPRDLREAEIHVFADTHLGDPHCDEAWISERVKRIAATPNAYALLNGDLMNVATKTSVSDIYAETLTPMQQLKRAEAIFAPLKGKILGGTIGNHCERIVKTDSIDLMEILSRELGFPYCPEGILLFISLGTLPGHVHGRPASYTLYMTHGTGGGRTMGGKVNAVQRMAQVVDADIFVMSHVHSPTVTRDTFYRADTSNKAVKPVERLYVITGASMDYGGYAQRQLYTPASKLSPVIRLRGDCKRADAVI